MNTIKATARAAHTVVEAGGEHYHFSMARAEFGDRAVLEKMTEQAQSEAACSFSDAAFIAAVQFKFMDGLASGQDRFKQIRICLRAESQSARTDLTAKLA